MEVAQASPAIASQSARFAVIHGPPALASHPARFMLCCPRRYLENFTPVMSTVGGLLIGLSSLMLLLFNGRVAGISGICGAALDERAGRDWRIAFMLGLVGAGFFIFVWMPQAFAFEIQRSPWALAVAGLLVGFGTRLGSGCTSGHGVCGISRFSKRSLVATATFMATGVITVALVNALFGGAP